jgi:CheY-like chemotaxis protein
MAEFNPAMTAAVPPQGRRARRVPLMCAANARPVNPLRHLMPSPTPFKATFREECHMTHLSNSSTVPAVDDALSLVSAPRRVLVVDDDHCMQHLMCQLMGDIGFRADAVNGGLAAMKCLSRSIYDLMITDLQMPDMDGYALSGWLKNQTKDTKVIVMTGLNPADVVNYMHNGIVDRWIFKPFSLNTLEEVLSELVPAGAFCRLVSAKTSVGLSGFARHGCQSDRPNPAYVKEAR